MVGDRAGDMLAGKNAGLKTVLVDSGYSISRLEEPVEADYHCANLRDFISGIFK